MKQLPNPATYEKEFKYMPWGKLVAEVLSLVKRKTPQKADVIDLMCGPGFLLGKIRRLRQDARLTGVDIDRRYIVYAKRHYKGITFHAANSLKWKASKRYDVVLCTAGLHHLAYSQHERFIKKLALLTKSNGYCVLADPYISKYRNEYERRLAAANLGHEYLKAVLVKKAPDDVVSATIDIMYNDILPKGEYKTYVERIERMIKRYFNSVTLHKTWPSNETRSFGDYYFILKKPV